MDTIENEEYEIPFTAKDVMVIFRQLLDALINNAYEVAEEVNKNNYDSPLECGLVLDDLKKLMSFFVHFIDIVEHFEEL